MHIGLVPDFFQDFPPCRRKGAFVPVDLSFRQHPVTVFAQLHDGNQRFAAAAQHHAAGCLDCRPCLVFSALHSASPQLQTVHR
jgi:hypothetical protein